jgi:hypothetical protein
MLAAIGVVAFAIAALSQRSQLQAIHFPSFTFLVLWFAALSAIASKTKRHFWIGFAVSEVFCIWLSGANHFEVRNDGLHPPNTQMTQLRFPNC